MEIILSENLIAVTLKYVFGINFVIISGRTVRRNPDSPYYMQILENAVGVISHLVLLSCHFPFETWVQTEVLTKAGTG